MLDVAVVVVVNVVVVVVAVDEVVVVVNMVVVKKDGMKTTKNDSPAAREPIVNRTRSTLEITEDNTVKTTRNGSTNIGDVIMPRIRNGSGKDFMTKSKENYGRISCVLGPGTKTL